MNAVKILVSKLAARLPWRRACRLLAEQSNGRGGLRTPAGLIIRTDRRHDSSQWRPRWEIFDGIGAGAGAGRERVWLQVERPLQQVVRVVGEHFVLAGDKPVAGLRFCHLTR
jgi:hypothetical protein